MPHDEHVIPVATDDGHRFELIDLGDRNATDMLLLIPGMGIPARHYIEFARALEASGLRVLIHEWRGIGSSSVRAARNCNWGYRELIELDLAGSIHAARESAPTARVWLAGHSLGGQLACIAAGRDVGATAGASAGGNGGGIAGVAVIASGAPYTRAYSGRMRWTLHLVFRLFPALATLAGYFPGRRVGWGGNEARSLISDWARTGRTGRYDLSTLDFDAEAALSKLSCPLLVLRMLDDSWVPQGSVDWLVAKMPHCQVAQRGIDRDRQGSPADHFNWLKRPSASAAEVHGWLKASTQD